VHPELASVLEFLEIEQCKDISVVNMRELNRTDMPNHSIICTAFSEKHCFRVASNLVKAVRALELPDSVKKPEVCGGKEDDW
jgi:ribosomal silencing factor RsfS